MYPPRPSDTTRSDAEIEVFHLIEGGLNDEWIGLHSLGITGHRFKPWAEIDFVLIGPPGIYCLEVKGGRVAREGGVWRFTNRHGETSAKTQGPFEQVGGASAALRQYLLQRMPLIKRAAVGYGVVMPDVTFRNQGPDVLPDLLCDARDRGSFPRYMDRLIRYWEGRLGGTTALPDVTRRAVLEELRGDFDLRPSLRTLVGTADDELLRLTKEQYRLLDELAGNERMLIRGGAGTGKTLLALQEAGRLGGLGKKVLLCCFNRNLAAYLREATRHLPNVSSWHLHGLMEDVITRGGKKHGLPAVDTTDLMDVIYPKRCVDGLIDLGEAEGNDVLIVDEGQDLLMPPYLDVFDTLLRGGLAAGCWRIFLDHNQDLFGGTAIPALSRLEACQPALRRLTVNCRNTAPVAIATALMSGTATEKTLATSGPEVERYWYSDRKDERRQVSRCINRLLSEELKPEQIVVLSRYRLENSCLVGGLEKVPCTLSVWQGVQAEPSTIPFSTIAAFKGLEADVVVLIDVDDLWGPAGRESAYVGASRARVVLAVFVDKRQEAAYQERAREFGERLTAEIPSAD